MMKKKVKKILKFAEGTPFYKDANFYSNAGDFLMQQVNNILQSKLGVTAGGIAKGALSGAATGAAIGSIIPGIGTAGAAVGGAIVGGITSSIGSGAKANVNSSSTHFNEIYTPGSGIASLFDDDGEARRSAARIQSNNIAKVQTEQIHSQYMIDPNVQTQPVLVAEGGIMRKPVDALVSPGEIAINPYTLEYRQFGSDNEEPNSKDNIKTVLERGDNVKSHAKHMIMPNGKTPADNSKMVLDSNMPEEMKRKMIKKIDNWESAHRTKPQEYAKFDDGGIVGINKYRYNKNMSDFAYWDKDKNEYKKEYLDWVNNLTEQDVRDIEAGKYGDMTEYFSKNKGKKLDVAIAQKLMTDKKYGNWHKIGQAVVDNKIKTKGPVLDDIPHMAKQINVFPGMTERVVHHRVGNAGEYADLTHLYKTGLEVPKLKKLANPSEADGVVAAYKAQNKGTSDWLSNIVDFAPLATAMFGNYDYERVRPRIARNHSIPVDYSVNDILTDNQIAHAINNYNVSQMGGSTGAYLAAANQSAANLMKANAQTRIYQKNKQNELIAKNIAQLNDWERYANNQMWAADVATDQNQGMAQQMEDQAKKDGYEFYTGHKYDRWKLSMLEPMYRYAVDDNIWKNFRV